MITLTKRVILSIVLLASLLTAYSTRCATREYAFSGPSLTGRFIIEEYVSPTPIGRGDEDQLVQEFVGPPYLFSATLAGVSQSTTQFTLVVKNNIVAFGRSDVYGLYGPDLEMVLMGPSVGSPYTSTLPHDLESYAGLHSIQIRNPDTGEWTGSQIESLVALRVLSIVRTPAGLALRWPVGSQLSLLESAPSLSPGETWTVVTDPVEIVEGSFSVTIAPTGASRFFRLRFH